jgi:GT2 family glycosyltransferase
VESSQDLKASIIVPTYGRREMLSHLLPCLLKQDFSTREYEVIVVDDGSREAVDELVDALAGRCEVPLLLLRKPNGGPASARIFGALRARGKYLVFLDDDMLVDADFIRAHVEAHQEVGRAAVNCLFDWSIEARPESFERWYRRRVSAWTRVRRAELRPIGAGIFELPSGLLTTANVSLSRSDYEKVGGFDAGYRFSCEDQDFGRRLGEIGVRCVVTTRAKVTHVESHNTLRLLCERQRVGASDTVRFMRRFSTFDLPECAKLVRVNGPVDVRQDTWFLAARKLLMTAVSGRLSPVAFGLIKLLERRHWGMPALDDAYELLVAAYFRKGWCEGLRLYEGNSGSLVSRLPRVHETRVKGG